MCKVLKRDGSIVNFDRTKIENAIRNANRDVEGSDKADEDTIKKIVDSIETESDLSVEKIQDEVEFNLMKHKKFKLAKMYITYRYKHQLERENYKTLMSKVRREA